MTNKAPKAPDGRSALEHLQESIKILQGAQVESGVAHAKPLSPRPSAEIQTGTAVQDLGANVRSRILHELWEGNSHNSSALSASESEDMSGFMKAGVEAFLDFLTTSRLRQVDIAAEFKRWHMEYFQKNRGNPSQMRVLQRLFIDTYCLFQKNREEAPQFFPGGGLKAALEEIDTIENAALQKLRALLAASQVSAISLFRDLQVIFNGGPANGRSIEKLPQVKGATIVEVAIAGVDFIRKIRTALEIDQLDPKGKVKKSPA